MGGLKYRRALIKLSGESLAGERGFGIDFGVVDRLSDEVKAVHQLGAGIGLVIGGGNIIRGSVASQQGMDRVSADYMGMLATVINALALQDILERKGVETRVMTAIRMEELAEPYIRRRAQRHMEKGRIVLFAAGTGNPYFTTDTAAALRAAEMGCDALFKGTSVDGVYSADPKTDAAARRFDRITFGEILVKDLRIMDPAAIALARDNGIPVVVFSIRTPGAASDILKGAGRFTLVTKD